MTIHYTKPVNVTLTKFSQAMGKALARGHWQALVREVVRNPLTSPFLAAEVANVVRSESQSLMTTKSPSLLRKTNKSDLLQFSWDSFFFFFFLFFYRNNTHLANRASSGRYN